jgi:hypothetical protein
LDHIQAYLLWHSKVWVFMGFYVLMTLSLIPFELMAPLPLIV